MRFPHYILLSFGLFMAFIIFLVIKTYRVNNELVAEDYYYQELEYQHRIDQRNRVVQKPIWREEADKWVVHFPDSMESKDVTGNVEFFRPSDASKDLKIPLSLNKKGEQIFLKKLFSKGLYTVKLEWKEKGLAFYNEKDLYLP